MTVTVTTAGFEIVKPQFDMYERGVRLKLYQAIENAASQVYAGARANLAGGVLKQRSGRTAAGLIMKFHQRADIATANIGTDWYVGRFWECGFRADQTAKGHFRAIKTGKRFTVSKLTPRGKLTAVRVYETGAKPVKGYSRTWTASTRRPFLQPALDAVRASFRTEVMSIGGTMK